MSEVHYDGFGAELAQAFYEGVVADEDYGAGDLGVFLVVVVDGLGFREVGGFWGVRVLLCVFL